MDTSPQQPCTAVSSTAKTSRRPPADPNGARAMAARNKNPTPCAPCQYSRQGCPLGMPCGRCITKGRPRDCVPGRSKARASSSIGEKFVSESGQRRQRSERAGSSALLSNPTDGYPVSRSSETISPIERPEYAPRDHEDLETPPSSDPSEGTQLMQVNHQTLSQAEHQQQTEQQAPLQVPFDTPTVSPYAGEASIISQRHIFQYVGQEHRAGSLAGIIEYNIEDAQNEMHSDAYDGHVLHYSTLLDQGAIQSDTNAQPSYTFPSMQTSDGNRWEATYTYPRDSLGSYENQEVPQAHMHPTQTYETYGSPDMIARLTADGTNPQTFANPPMANLGSQLLESNAESLAYRPLMTSDHSSITARFGYVGNVDVVMNEASDGSNLRSPAISQSSVSLLIESITRWSDADITEDTIREYVQYYDQHEPEFSEIPAVLTSVQNSGFVD